MTGNQHSGTPAPADRHPAEREAKDAAAAALGASASGHGERVFTGLGVAPGVAIGPAHVRERRDLDVVTRHIPAAEVDTERGRFERAVRKARRQLRKIRAKANQVHGESAEELDYLLDAHMQMLKSRSLLQGVEQRIRERCINAEAAVMAEVDRIAQGFAAMEDPYLKARAAEMREVGMRIVRNLMESPYRSFHGLDPESIIIAEEITPADTALMDPREIGGFATVLGGAEGHTAIMARSLGLPAVLGIPNLLRGVEADETVIVDGSRGVVIVNPTAERLTEYRRRAAELEREAEALQQLRDEPAETTDGHRVALHANLELPREVGQAITVGAEGVGLLRTEFMYMNRADLPGEDEQYHQLREIVDGMGGRTVTIRTLDVGGEKLAWALGDDLGTGPNPALGMRAIRLSLSRRELLETQLAAILRAAAHGPVRILLPMVTTAGEIRETREVLANVHERLHERGVQVPHEIPPVGAMIEVPGAALAADTLAPQADFFAIGTNDLTMYTLAIDRTEDDVAHLYNPLHPAVLRLIRSAAEAARAARIDISVCGEMAGDPRYTPLFLGLGVDTLSMAPKTLPRVKQRVRALSRERAQHCAEQILTRSDSRDIAALLDAQG
ncbi:phosphoenolpyruvate--protein phosphotransferase [Limimonas halophila]|uniref:Phosphoenolpyruvate-protein phosphotransferase n=1 Tax=Limimonas halophila TaxID=1082479 RepID=A0A1G7TEY0_9PROT|nr:phosphoenolpyruvate--protein phosphotransferase [Limimonas halophila]SDG33785.1 phosphoenolpyruvate--protein phosphotransferase [Limimonas halophila]